MSKKQLEVYIKDIMRHIRNRKIDTNERMKKINDEYYSKLDFLCTQYKDMLNER